MELALVNLIDNAVKYSDSGKTIWIECQNEGDQIRISVMDQGKGIAPEHQSRIFERFYRIERGRSRELGGTGLGLAIVKHIVLIHKGRIEVKSEQGRGSEFMIHIPSGTE
jgi:two-component system phosphate regulon sensor histidine kinase PhoR